MNTPMTKRSTYWRTILCTIVAFCFISQIAICYADLAGFMRCSHESTEQHDASALSLTADDCDCDGYPTEMALFDPVHMGKGPETFSFVFIRDTFALDGPAREIDYPPQLS